MRRHEPIPVMTVEGAATAWYVQQAHAATIEATGGRIADVGKYLRTVNRLARWLRWRDKRVAEIREGDRWW